MKSTVHPFQTDDARLRSIHDKVIANQRLDLADVTTLFASKDILAIGWLANHVRERLWGNATQFRVDALSTVFATRSAPLLPQVESIGLNADRIIVLGTEFDVVCAAAGTFKNAWPKVDVIATTVEELAECSSKLESAVTRLRSAGVNGLLGEGVELFLPEVRKRVWHSAAGSEQRAEVRRVSAAAGLRVPLYLVQRNSTPEQQAEELLSFRGDRSQSFSAVSFVPDAATTPVLAVSTGMQEMKQIAVARLALDHVPHVCASWQMLGGKLIQIALRFGASLLDGTSLDAGVDHGDRKQDLAREIRVAGRDPEEIPSMRQVIVMTK